MQLVRVTAVSLLAEILLYRVSHIYALRIRMCLCTTLPFTMPAYKSLLAFKKAGVCCILSAAVVHCWQVAFGCAPDVSQQRIPNASSVHLLYDIEMHLSHS